MKGFVGIFLGLLFVCSPIVAQSQTAIRVNAGGPGYDDSKGHWWNADFGYNGGALSTTAPSATVTGTSDPYLYKSARYGESTNPELQYQFAAAKGTYTVNLYFAETAFKSAGQRVFDVQMQGTTVFSSIDIYAAVGADHALEKSTTISNTTGTITIRFVHHANANNPIVSAIEIIPGTLSNPAPLQITTGTLSAGQVGVSYSSMVQATGGTTPYHWSINSGTLPNGLGLSSTSGTISGTPNAAGSFTFTVKATDSTSPTALTTTKSFTLTVGAAASPVEITTGSLPGGQVGTSYSTTLSASSGTPPYTWSVSSGSLPAGLGLSSSGVISGTPSTSGTSEFTVSVKDSGSPATSANASFSITVAAASAYSVKLNWTQSPSSGVTGYNVYRSTVSGSGYTKLNSTPVSGLTYTDSSVTGGKTYYYVTTSVDSAGAESSYSEQITMSIP